MSLPRLVPLYHYTSPEVVPYLFEGGLRMSRHGLSQGGVHFSTMGPASYGLGTVLYEENMIKVNHRQIQESELSFADASSSHSIFRQYFCFLHF